ncbi:hypothetical protein GIB67_004375 [Kingdonia uniflora]|uniref:DUF1421 domain-containing protein n=1 Tax=Kingdonia uniflora TaxID=39325 RepID=A0A7J7MRJ4_9MAGN|nr:hypothetical protein GIB67_004375 [Kingdonia uniflora]
MNSSQFMDKQIMDLSRSQNNNNNNNDVFEFLNPEEEEERHQQQQQQHDIVVGSKKKEEILASYDFQPIRPLGAVSASQSAVNLEGSNNGGGGTRVWNSADSKTSTSTRNYGYIDSNESAKFTQENNLNSQNGDILLEIDRTMKKHADNMLHALEGVSARLVQMESRTRNLESLVGDLKVSVENSHGSTNGKLRQLENILREVHTGVQVLRDKQEIVEAHLHLAKLQSSQDDQQPERQNNTVHSDSAQQVAFALQQSHQSLQPHPVSILSPPNAPPPTPPQQNPQPAQFPAQIPQNQIPIPQPYFQPPGQLPEVPHQQYQPLPPQQLQQPPTPPQQYQSAPQHSQYQSAPQHQQYPHTSQPSQQQPPQQQPSVGHVNPPPHLQPPIVGHNPEEVSYLQPPQSYPPNRNPSSTPFYGGSSQMYEPPLNRPSSGYGPSSGQNFGDSYPYGGTTPPSHYGKPPQLSSSPSAPSGGGNSYPRLPTAQNLPHALPTAGNIGAGGGSSSSGSGNRVPVDDVIDKVATMGFSRDQVRATVRKLTENGQSVDLNVVLDKLMNDVDVQQPPKGWFGR